MTKRQPAVGATLAVVLLGAAVGVVVTMHFHGAKSQRAQTTTAGGTSSSPQAVPEVPTSLPPAGVDVKGIVTLKPYSGSPALPADRAIKMHHGGDLPPYHYASLLARVTVAFTLPPEGASAKKYRPIKNKPCWVVNYTLPKAISVETVPGNPPLMVTHQVEVFDAKTVAYAVGIFTRKTRLQSSESRRREAGPRRPRAF